MLGAAALIVAFAGIAHAAPPSEPPGAAACSGCHPASPSVETPVPRLVGRDPGDIVAAVRAFRAGERPGTVMDRIAKGYSDDEIAAIAARYHAQPQ